MPKAYSYVRFSTPEQSRGDSLRRQTEAAEEYAARNGLELDQSLTFEDLGVSAHRGRHLETGKLGEFLDAVRNGFVERGSYLIVENLDRLSRQKARKALRVLEDICEEGITVVTLNDGQEYTAETLDDDPTSLFISILTFWRGHQESERKSRLAKSTWNQKRKNAREKPLTARTPAWLRLNKETGEFEKIDDRVKVVKRIFRDTLRGKGKALIAKELNQEEVPTFGKSKWWHRSYIDKILKNPAVVGTFTPHTTVEEQDDDGVSRRRRKPLDPVPRYFPSVVKKEEFQRVQALKNGGGNPRRGRHADQGLRNIFGGIGYCGRCGETVQRVNKGDPPKGRPYLVCSQARAGAGCKYEQARYDHLEELFLLQAGELLHKAPSGDQDQPDLDEKISKLEAALGELDDRIGRLLDSIEAGSSEAASSRLAELERAKEEAEEDRKQLLDRKAQTMGKAVGRRIADLWALLIDSEGEPRDPATLKREQVNALMRQLFASVTVDYDEGLLRLAWAHGGESSIFYRFPQRSMELGAL